MKGSPVTYTTACESLGKEQQQQQQQIAGSEF